MKFHLPLPGRRLRRILTLLGQAALCCVLTAARLGGLYAPSVWRRPPPQGRACFPCWVLPAERCCFWIFNRGCAMPPLPSLLCRPDGLL